MYQFLQIVVTSPIICVIEWLNNVKCHNIGILNKYIEERPDGVPLVTVSNHQSCLDDPLIWGRYEYKNIER